MALISVDLPAPLSPTTATTSPAPTSKSTSVSASTAPNRLVTPLSSRSGRAEAAVSEAVVIQCSLSRGLLNPVLRAGGLVGAGADVGGLPVAVLDHGRLDLVGRHRGDRQLQRRDVDLAVVLGRRGALGLLALGQCDRPLGGLLGQ